MQKNAHFLNFALKFGGDSLIQLSTMKKSVSNSHTGTRDVNITI